MNELSSFIIRHRTNRSCPNDKYNKGKNSEEAVRYAFSSVGRALWVTTLVLVAGFMVLAQSTFKLNADMGLLTALTIFIALVVDFLFLPPLLILLDGKKQAAANRTLTTSNLTLNKGDAK